MHHEGQVHAELLGHQLPELAAVLVSHPTVSADEAQASPGVEAPQRDFVKADVDIGAAAHGGASAAVGGHAVVRHVFETDVRRIANDVVGSMVRVRLQQVVALSDPGFGYLPGLLRELSCVKQLSLDQRTAVTHVAVQEIKGVHGV